MGNPEIKVPEHPFTYGGEAEPLCRECQLPCQLDVTSVDCFRRFFLQGMLHCTYFVHGYCFLIDTPGCVFDNGGEHETYWMNLLNEYFHSAKSSDADDENFKQRQEEFRKLIADQIDSRQVSLCRYLEEIYHRVMETGGGINEEMMEKLDDAYLALLAGTSRKK